MNNKIKLYLGRIALVLTASVSAFAHQAEAAGLGTGVLTLEDADVSGSMAWKSGVAPTTVRIPLQFEDVFGNAISGYDATFQLGGTSGNSTM